VEELKAQNDQTDNKVLDMQTRSMRDNLMFFNLPEPDKEEDEEGEHGTSPARREEDCTQTILKFCTEQLKMEDAGTIRLDRAHRVGARKMGSIRPIVARFNYYQDRERVRKAAKNLQGTKYGISEQYPREIQERRRILIDIKKQESAKGKKCALSVDKLYVDGRLYKGPRVTWA
jgi:hypothetical protein